MTIQLFILILGLLIGSFLNVCIHRIPLNRTVVTEPSHCPMCGNRIKWYDLIPVISYILLLGKCRFCKNKISIYYPLVELLNAAAYLLIYSRYGLSIQLLGMTFLTSALIVASFIDLEHGIIPDCIIVILLVAGVAYSFFHTSITWTEAVMGFFAASVPLLIIAILSGGNMGGGDIKLMAVSGLFMGWKMILLSLILGSIIGSVIGIILIIFKVIKLKQRIPFGPFLSAGIFTSIIYGHDLLRWYLNFYK